MTVDELNDYEKSKRLYYIKLRLLTTRCFPCSLPTQNNTDDLIPHNYEFSVIDAERTHNYNISKTPSKNSALPKIFNKNSFSSKKPNFVEKKTLNHHSLTEKNNKKKILPLNSCLLDVPLIVNNKIVSSNTLKKLGKHKCKRIKKHFPNEIINCQSLNLKLIKKELNPQVFKNVFTPITPDNISNAKLIKNVNKNLKMVNNDDFVEIINKGLFN